MGLEVYWLEFAENKLDDIFSFYSEKAGIKTAQKLVKGIIQSTIGLAQQPEIGQVEMYLNHRPEKFRYLVYGNYKIIYWINDQYNRVEIANVFDARQDPDKLDETR